MSFFFQILCATENRISCQMDICSTSSVIEIWNWCAIINCGFRLHASNRHSSLLPSVQYQSKRKKRTAHLSVRKSYGRMNDLHATFEVEQMDIGRKSDVAAFHFLALRKWLLQWRRRNLRHIFPDMFRWTWKIYRKTFARDCLRTLRIKIVRVRSSLIWHIVINVF